MKGLSVVILNKTDYIERLENMVKECTDTGTYTLTKDNTVKNFKEVLKRNFKRYDKLDDMLSTCNLPARVHTSVKTQEFWSAGNVNINDLNSKPIRDQISKMACSAAKAISNYLRPLCKKSIPLMIRFPSLMW